MNHPPRSAHFLPRSDFSKSHHADKSSQHACLGRGGYKWRVRRFAADGVASISAPPFVRGGGVTAPSRYRPVCVAWFFFFGKASIAPGITPNEPNPTRPI